MERLLLKPSEVGQVLGVGRSLVYSMLASGELPSIRVGRCIRVPKVSLERWISARESLGEKTGLAGGGCGGGLDQS
jgi:excisionase family DNA binding protein